MTTAVLLAILGLVAGVFVEGIVGSYHYDGSLWPWPHCRGCGHAAPPVSLAPCVGSLLCPRCPACRRSWYGRALQIQVATGAAFFALGVQYGGYPLLLVVSLIEAAVLVAVLFIDLELRLIPTLLVVLLVCLALASATAWPGLGLWNALLGGAIGFISFSLLVVLARTFFGEGALGMGDANLALAVGCITGYPSVVFALSFGVFLGGLGAIAILVARSGSGGLGAGLRSTIPYGPYLVLGVLYVLSRGNTLAPLAHF